MGICTDIDIGIVYTGKQGIFRRKGVVYKYSAVYMSLIWTINAAICTCYHTAMGYMHI